MELNEKWLKHWVLDVESDGPCPGQYNMINFGLVNVFEPKLSVSHGVLPPHVLNNGGIPEARAVSGISWDDQVNFVGDLKLIMKDAQQWLRDLSKATRITIWSDNPAYDWQFWNFYCHTYTAENVAGFSARRIGDLDAGRRKEPFNTNAWKKRRVTNHTHNPVDDARGNVEALRWIIGEM